MAYLSHYKLTVWIDQDDGGEPGSMRSLEDRVRRLLTRELAGSDAELVDVEADEDTTADEYAAAHCLPDDGDYTEADDLPEWQRREMGR